MGVSPVLRHDKRDDPCRRIITSFLKKDGPVSRTAKPWAIKALIYRTT